MGRSSIVLREPGTVSPGRLSLLVILGGAVAGVFLHLLAAAFGAGGPGPVRGALLGSLLLAATLEDLRSGRIPNPLTGGAAVAAVVLVSVSPEYSLVWAFVGATTGATLLLSARWIGVVLYGRPGIGMGDIKLAATVGFLTGPGVGWALYLAVLVGACVGVCLLLRGRITRYDRLAFAPFIAAGTVVAVYVLPFQWVWYQVLSPLAG